VETEWLFELEFLWGASMENRLFLFILFYLTFAISCTTTVTVDRAVETIAWNTLDMISEEEDRVIAVYNLRNLTENGDMNEILTTKLTTELANTARYEERNIIIVSRQIFDEVFRENAFFLSEMSDDKQQIEIGKLLGADLILTGSLKKTDTDIYDIDTQLVDIETGKVIGGDTFTFWVNLPAEKN
jgi:TolB-like protein